LIHFYKRFNMASLVTSGDFTVITCGHKFVIKSSGRNSIHEVPKPVINLQEAQDDNATENKKSSTSQDLPKINCCALSPCLKYLALCDELKQLTVWTISSMSLKVQQNLVRKASKVIFTSDSKSILIADKNGDVYQIETESASEPRLLLGHLSMLLDVLVDRSGKFVITADRDEKIRVSSFPNSYNIHNYCLGHTEFVTSISFLSQDLLVSGSGDGTVKLWKYLEGKEIASREVFQDLELPINVNNLKVKDNLENVEPLDNMDKRVDPPSQPAVVSVKSLNSSQFVVQVEGYVGLCLYRYDGNLVFTQNLELKSLLLDFDVFNDMLIILSKDQETFNLDKYLLENDKLVFKHSVSLNEYAELFSSVDNFEDEGLGNLHKRWFDNVKEYMERKEARINKSKSSENPASKKQKLEL